MGYKDFFGFKGLGAGGGEGGTLTSRQGAQLILKCRTVSGGAVVDNASAPSAVAENVLEDRQFRATQTTLYLEIAHWMLHPGRQTPVPIHSAVAHEQRQSVSREDHVGCAWKIAASKAKPKPKLVGDSSDVAEASGWRRW